MMDRQRLFVHCLTVFAPLFLCAESRVFRIGYISGSQRAPGSFRYNRPGYQISGAISLAIDQINRHHPDGLLANHTLEFEYAETFGNEDESIRETAKLALAHVGAIIGPQETCLHESRIAATFKTLMLSYFCEHTSSDRLSRSESSTFINVKPPVIQIAKAVSSLLLKYNWKKVTFVYNNDTESNRRAAESISCMLAMNDIEILQSRTWDYDFYVGFETDGFEQGISPFHSIIQDTKDRTRIYVILGGQDAHVGFMNAMEDEKLLDHGDYFVVGVYPNPYKPHKPEIYLRGKFEDGVSKKSIKAFRSFLAVIPTPPKDQRFQEFNKLVLAWLVKPPFDFQLQLNTVDLPKTIRAEATYLYDAVFLYAKALHRCLENTTACPDPTDGTKLAGYILDRRYISAMGDGGYIDAYGQALGNYSLLGLKEPTAQETDLGLVEIGTFLLNQNRSHLPSLVLKDNQQIHWIQGHPPLDEPPCGYANGKCPAKQSQTKTIIIVIGVVSVALILLCSVIIALRCWWKFDQDLATALWRIDWKDLHAEELMEHINNSLLDAEYKPQTVNLSSVASIMDMDSGYNELRVNTIHTELGLYRKQLVAIKRIRKRHVDFKKPEIKRELKTIRELRNDNLCGIIGACITPVVCIVTEYCQRGSLIDLLYDENFALDDMFLSSLVSDLAKGMWYIHESHLLSHGSLKPSNCLVDHLFVLKITDYGLHEFSGRTEQLHSTKRRENDAFFDRLLWTAPELLRLHYPPPEGTQKADVYSFGIVISEIYGRAGPFGQTKLSSKEIIARLRAGPPFFRPPLDSPSINIPQCVISLMADCWHEDPDLRPDFQNIKRRLMPVAGLEEDKKKEVNIMDKLMATLQRYTNNLEALVGERTIQLQEEKKKTETLLYQILPRSVAEHLIKEEKVEAEQFECVTIFFSDIVGFTAMSADSTPLEVVAFLNDLYTLFDSLLEQYDAYKVETIGDSYMVCSGLPIRNGNQHAGVIASMALHLLDAIKSFRIAHRPSMSLRMRVGIHSGPVVAGVVGLKMPRYCLFGDTVNTASRFESTGEAQKIHCSPQAKEILDELGGYLLEPRGIVPMKGKGDQLTYWLTDENDTYKDQRQQQDYSCLPHASPILSKWGQGQLRPKRRLSFARPNRGSPFASRAHSRLNSECSNVNLLETIQEFRNAHALHHASGSVPNLARCTTNVAEQSVHYTTVADTMPLLEDQDSLPSSRRSTDRPGPGSYEMRNTPDYATMMQSMARID